MFTYIISRIFILFVLILILISAGFTFYFNGFYSSNLPTIFLNMLVYFIPIALFSSIILFYSVFLFRRKHSHLNKSISNHLSLNSGLTIIQVLFVGFLLLTLNFYLNEFVLSKNISSYVQSNYIQHRKQDTIDKQNQVKQIFNAVADEMILGDYSNSAQIIKKRLYHNSELSTIVQKILLDMYKDHQNIVLQAQKSIKDFNKGYNFLQTNKYQRAMQFFSSQNSDLKDYFIQRANQAYNFQSSTDKQSMRIKILFDLIDYGKKYKVINKSEFNYIYEQFTLLYFTYAEQCNSTNTTLEYIIDNPIRSNIYFFSNKKEVIQRQTPIRKDLKLISGKNTYALGKTLILSGQFQILKNNQICLKDIVLLTNLKEISNSPIPRAYYIPSALLKDNKIIVSRFDNLLKDKRTPSAVYEIPNQNESFLKVPDKFNFGEIIYANKLLQNVSNASLLDLIRFTNHKINTSQTFYITTIYLIEKLSYYATNIILLFIFSIGGFILRTRYEKSPNWLTRILISIFIIILSFFFYYLIKEISFIPIKEIWFQFFN